MFHDYWIFWIVAITATLFGNWGRSHRGRNRQHETAHDVLRRRLAAGEITPEEYEQRKVLVDRDT